MFKHIENYLIIIVAALLGTLLFSECCYGFDIDASGNMTLPDPKTVNFDIPVPDLLDAGIDVARVSGQVKASSIKKISEVVASHPEESLAIIRSWLAEESGERAA